MQSNHLTARPSTGFLRIIIVPAREIPWTLFDGLHAIKTSRIDFATRNKIGHASIMELASREPRPEMTDAASSPPDEDLGTTLRRNRIPASRLPGSCSQRISKVIERRTLTDKRLLKRRQRFPNIGKRTFGIIE